MVRGEKQNHKPPGSIHTKDFTNTVRRRNAYRYRYRLSSHPLDQEAVGIFSLKI